MNLNAERRAAAESSSKRDASAASVAPSAHDRGGVERDEGGEGVEDLPAGLGLGVLERLDQRLGVADQLVGRERRDGRDDAGRLLALAAVGARELGEDVLDRGAVQVDLLGHV